jgi:sec-independent protein translocase protein TatA
LVVGRNRVFELRPCRPQTGLAKPGLIELTPLSGGTIKRMILAEIFGPDAIVVIVLAVVLLFGADRLPKLMRSFGEASRELKKAQKDDTGESEGDTITVSKADLDALLDEREAQTRSEATPPPPPAD